jgi:hybrid cluster-associated redox disulfide protein
MDKNDALHVQLTVEEVLRKWPQTWVVFMSKGTYCTGCFVQRFCTLQEVAETYQIAIEDLITELEHQVNSPNQSQRSIL